MLFVILTIFARLDSFSTRKALSDCDPLKCSQLSHSQPKNKGQTTQRRQHSRYDLSLSYLDDPKVWLQNEDITNICHEIYKNFTRQPWTGIQNLDRFCHYPIPADLIPIKFDRNRGIFTCDSLSWSILLISERVMFVPLHLGYKHWTLLTLDSRLRSRCAVFWDPAGYRCSKEI